MKTNTIHTGDVLRILKTLPDESVDCVVTSPPYWGLRDYGTGTWEGGDPDCDHIMPRNVNRVKPGGKQLQASGANVWRTCGKCGAKREDPQIGNEDTFEEYADKLLAITAELQRVLKKTGTLWWNHGDSYASQHTGGQHGKSAQFKDRKVIDSQDIRQPDGKRAFPEKSLILQAHRLAIRMIDEQGWILRNQIIWHKPNAMPSSAKDRLTPDFEPVFFFTKSKKYHFEQLLEEYTKPLDRWGGENLKAQDGDNWGKATGQEIYRDRNMRPNPKGRNKRTVWSIPTRAYTGAHFAVFPEALVETPIKAGCPEMICEKCGVAREKIIESKSNWEYRKTKGATGGAMHKGPSQQVGKGWSHDLDPKRTIKGLTDCGCNAGFRPGTVLDPFAGAGTTLVVARNLGRQYIGIEINPKYVKMANDRLRQSNLL